MCKIGYNLLESPLTPIVGTAVGSLMSITTIALGVLSDQEGMRGRTGLILLGSTGLGIGSFTLGFSICSYLLNKRRRG